jgi:hypothetical protein
LVESTEPTVGARTLVTLTGVRPAMFGHVTVVVASR